MTTAVDGGSGGDCGGRLTINGGSDGMVPTPIGMRSTEGRIGWRGIGGGGREMQVVRVGIENSAVVEDVSIGVEGRMGTAQGQSCQVVCR